MKNLKKKIFNWLFKDQLLELNRLLNHANVNADIAKAAAKNCEWQEKKLKDTVGSIQVATDIHLKSPSWAVICLQGKRADFVKFVDLDQRSIEDIGRYLRRFERRNVIADMPYCIPKNEFFKIDNRYEK